MRLLVVAKFFDQSNTGLIWFGLFVYGLSAFLYAASQAYVKQQQKCFDNPDMYDLVNLPDCAALWAIIIGMAGYFLAVFFTSFCCINKQKICPLVGVILFGGAGIMGILYLYDVNDDTLIENVSDQQKAFIAAPGAYLFLTSASMMVYSLGLCLSNYKG